MQALICQWRLSLYGVEIYDVESIRSVKYMIRSIIWLLQWFLDSVMTHKHMGCRTEGVGGVSC